MIISKGRRERIVTRINIRAERIGDRTRERAGRRQGNQREEGACKERVTRGWRRLR